MVDLLFSTAPTVVTSSPDPDGARFAQNSLDFENPGIPVVPDFDDDELVDDASESDCEVPHPKRPRILEDVRAINETVRGGGPARVGRNPGWPAVWLWLITCVRSFTEPVMWEIFSGLAGLTHEFQRQGWPCAPPIDILCHRDFNCLEAGFICVIIGLILERRIRYLHLGPPCSSFSMAVNRFPTYRMRSK